MSLALADRVDTVRLFRAAPKAPSFLTSVIPMLCTSMCACGCACVCMHSMCVDGRGSVDMCVWGGGGGVNMSVSILLISVYSSSYTALPAKAELGIRCNSSFDQKAILGYTLNNDTTKNCRILAYCS